MSVKWAVLGVMVVSNCDSCDGSTGTTGGVDVDEPLVTQGCALRGDIDADLDVYEGGCRDVLFYAADQTGLDGASVIVRFSRAGAATEASQAQAPTDWTLDLPAEASLVVEVGAYVDFLACTDVAYGPYTVDETFQATSGTAALSIDPDVPAPAHGPMGKATLSVDAVLQSDHGRQVSVECIWEDKTVGGRW